LEFVAFDADDIEDALLGLAGRAEIAAVVWIFMDDGVKYAFFVSGNMVACATMQESIRNGRRANR
jgi:hypothetical protein